MLKFNITKPTVARFLNETTTKTFLWFLLYSFGYLQLDFRWFLLCAGIIYLCNVLWASKIWKKKAERKSGANMTTEVPGNLPDWVLNPDIHRVEWANTLMKQLWQPHFEDHVKQLLHSIETDEALSKRLAGYHIKSVRFPRASLGKIPPRLAGVKVHNSTFSSVQHDEIILDLSIQYAGDLCIEIEVVRRTMLT